MVDSMVENGRGLDHPEGGPADSRGPPWSRHGLPAAADNAPWDGPLGVWACVQYTVSDNGAATDRCSARAAQTMLYVKIMGP